MPDLPTLAEPRLKFFADLRVEVGAPQQVGQTVHGLRRLIPIIGGTATGWMAGAPGCCQAVRIFSSS